MEAGVHLVRMHFVEGPDPRVAFRSTDSPEQELILTVLANTGRTLYGGPIIVRVKYLPLP